MAKTEWQKGFEGIVGELVGTVNGMRDDIKRLNGDLKTHVRDHRAGWLWIIPTTLMLANLIFMMLQYYRG